MVDIQQNSSIYNLHNDILSLIMKDKMNFEDCEMINEVFALNMSKFDLFIIVVDNKLCNMVIDLHKINYRNFYDIIEHSAFEFNDVVKLVYNIANNTINNTNKYEINLRYHLQFDERTRDASIMCMKIMLTMIDFYVSGEFQINNPYYYLNTYISNILTNYIISCDVRTFYKIDDFHKKGILKFRLMLIQSKWYKTSIDIYKLFKAYFQHICILQITNDIEQIQFDIDYEDIIDYPETKECLRELLDI